MVFGPEPAPLRPGTGPGTANRLHTKVRCIPPLRSPASIPEYHSEVDLNFVFYQVPPLHAVSEQIHLAKVIGNVHPNSQAEPTAQPERSVISEGYLWLGLVGGSGIHAYRTIP